MSELAEVILRYALMALLLPGPRPLETADDVCAFRAFPAEPAAGGAGGLDVNRPPRVAPEAPPPRSRWV